MNRIEQIEKLKEASLNSQIQFYEHQNNFRDNIIQLWFEEIKEKKYLKNTHWKISYEQFGISDFFRIKTRRSEIPKELRDLINPSEHEKFDLTENISLRFYDEDVFLDYKNIQELYNFCEEHEISIDLSRIEEDIKQYTKEIEKLNKILEKCDAFQKRT